MGSSKFDTSDELLRQRGLIITLGTALSLSYTIIGTTKAIKSSEVASLHVPMASCLVGNLHNASETVLETYVLSVEAAFGRITIFGDAARTVVDKPFAWKTTHDYFRQKDPSLISPADRATLHSDIASVHGNMWETMV